MEILGSGVVFSTIKLKYIPTQCSRGKLKERVKLTLIYTFVSARGIHLPKSFVFSLGCRGWAHLRLTAVSKHAITFTLRLSTDILTELALLVQAREWGGILYY